MPLAGWLVPRCWPRRADDVTYISSHDEPSGHVSHHTMSTSTPNSRPKRAEASKSERRSNPVLRSLIDEMLEKLRELNRKVPNWSEKEHSQAVADLESVMARVRRAAAKQEPPK